MQRMEEGRAHCVMIPYPTQGHISPTLRLAKFLHSSHGFYVTFVNTEFNHARLLRSQGAAAVAGLPGFRFEAIPDGLPPSDLDATQDLRDLCASIQSNFLLPPLLRLLRRLNEPSSGAPPVTRIISDGMMSFCVDAAKELQIPLSAFWTASACGLMGYLHFPALLLRGITPLKDESCVSNGYLDAKVDWIPGMSNEMRFKDLPSFIQTTDPDDIFFNYLSNSARRLNEAGAIIINTFDELEGAVLRSLRSILSPPIYTVGPVHMLFRSGGASLWREDSGWKEWLDCRDPLSVVFVNFGSITVMSNAQLAEFAWGLAGSGFDFLWVVRGDLVRGPNDLQPFLPLEFLEATKNRGLIVGWCAQEDVLLHPAVGCFLTHAGWNSILETLAAGKPLLCWPFFAEQQTNSRYASAEWGVGVQIDSHVKRGELECLISEVMGSNKAFRNKAEKWKQSAIKAVQEGGSSYTNFEAIVNQVLR